MTKKLLGNCGVDSGQLIIGDPCYFKDWKDGEWNDHNSHYGQACELTLGKRGGGQMTITGIAGDGVVFGTGGDGNFPVYGHYNEDGSIKKITIEF